MQIHQLRRKHKERLSRRIGRGGRRGTYSGRGMKGQRARAGAKIRPEAREAVKKIPKLRGYKFKSFRAAQETINLDRIDRLFPEGAVITARELVERGAISRVKGKIPKVKILGRGELKKKFIFKDVTFSKSAAQKGISQKSL